MGKLRVHNIEAQSGTNVDLGAVGDVVTLASDSLQTNLYKDSGGNTLFQSDGAGTLSNVNSGLKGAGPVLIQSQTVGSAVSEVLFTTWIDSNYDHYMIVLINCQPATDNTDFGFQTSTNGGSSYGVSKTTTSFRAMHNEANSQALFGYVTGFDYPGNPDTEKQWIAYQIGNTGDESCSGIIHFFVPSAATFVKQFYLRSNTYGASVESIDFYASGYWNTPSAINAFRFAMFSGNINAGTIKLYGIS